MAYVKRDHNNKIIAVYESPQPEATEQLALNAPELLEFLLHSATQQDARTILSQSDLELVRVLEDLINTLIDKKVIMFTDLPLAAREKLAGREKIRGHLNSLEDLIGDDSGIL